MKKNTNTVPETEVRGILWLILTEPKPNNHDLYITHCMYIVCEKIKGELGHVFGLYTSHQSCVYKLPAISNQ